MRARCTNDPAWAGRPPGATCGRDVAYVGNCEVGAAAPCAWHSGTGGLDCWKYRYLVGDGAWMAGSLGGTNDVRDRLRRRCRRGPCRAAGVRTWRILDEIEEQLTEQPTQETRNKKLLPGLGRPGIKNCRSGSCVLGSTGCFTTWTMPNAWSRCGRFAASHGMPPRRRSCENAGNRTGHT